MLASTIVAMLLAGAALALARVTALYRGVSLRWVWVLATVASLVFALLWLRPSPAPSATVVRAAARMSAASTAASGDAISAGRLAPVAVAPVTRLPSIELPHIPRALERALLAMWLVASTVLLLLLFATAIRLHEERKQWSVREVANTRVLVSKTFGPAIVGVHRPVIVLPEWVLALNEPSQRAIVTHEEEHRAARDPAILLAGLATIVLMPWNIGLWMTWRGLRRAIELDCDARVLARGIDGGEYARVLLGAWQSTHGSWLPSTAFAERASGLGARVEHLMRPAPQRRIMRTLIGTMVAAGLVFIACATPSPQRPTTAANAPYPLVIIDGVKRPDLPPRFRYVGAVVAETTTVPTYRVFYKGTQVEDTIARNLYPSLDSGGMMQTIDAPASAVHFGDQARYGAVLYYTKKYRDAGGAIIAPTEGNMAVRAADPATSPADMARSVYNRMFNGISLSPDRTAQALKIIENEGTEQRAVRGPILVSWPRRIELNAKRDADLHALLTSDADRARFDVRSLESRPRNVTVDLVALSMYNNFFGERPTTTTNVKARAISLIVAALNDEVALYRRAPDAFDERMAIRLTRDSALRELFTTDEEKTIFDKRAARTRDGEIKRP